MTGPHDATPGAIPPRREDRPGLRACLPAVILGFALGGFFDGILLHQILQWHHLLSLVPGAGDLRMQILWDGYFHAAMYAVALVGLAALWRGRAAVGADPRRRLWAMLPVGFGLWHGVDAVLSHWLLGLHRIKDDSPVPLLWDMGWLVGFGILPAAAGLYLALGPRGPDRPLGGAMAALTALALGMGGWAAEPPGERGVASVVFRDGLSEAQIRARLAASGATLLWQEPELSLALVRLPPGSGWRLYGRGALLVAGGGLPAGCLGWSAV